MPKKNAGQDDLQFDLQTRTVMAAATNDHTTTKEKINAIKEVVKGKSNSDLHLVLQFYDNNVERTIQAFLEDGAEEALNQWQKTGPKTVKQQNSQPKKRRRHKPKSKTEQAPSVNSDETETLSIDTGHAVVNGDIDTNEFSDCGDDVHLSSTIYTNKTNNTDKLISSVDYNDSLVNVSDVNSVVPSRRNDNVSNFDDNLASVSAQENEQRNFEKLKIHVTKGSHDTVIKYDNSNYNITKDIDQSLYYDKHVDISSHKPVLDYTTSVPITSTIVNKDNIESSTHKFGGLTSAVNDIELSIQEHDGMNALKPVLNGPKTAEIGDSIVQITEPETLKSRRRKKQTNLESTTKTESDATTISGDKSVLLNSELVSKTTTATNADSNVDTSHDINNESETFKTKALPVSDSSHEKTIESTHKKKDASMLNDESTKATSTSTNEHTKDVPVVANQTSKSKRQQDRRKKPQNNVKPSQERDRHVSTSSNSTSGQSFDRMLKDLNRQAISLERLKLLLTEELGRSQKRIKTVFETVRQSLNAREALMEKQLSEVKEQSLKTMEERVVLADSLRMRAGRSSTYKEKEINELKTDMKHYLIERRIDEDLCRSLRFLYNADAIENEISKLGEVIPLDTPYFKRKDSKPSDSTASSNANSTSPNASTSHKTNPSKTRNDVSKVVSDVKIDVKVDEDRPTEPVEEPQVFSKPRPGDRVFSSKSTDWSYRAPPSGNNRRGNNRPVVNRGGRNQGGSNAGNWQNRRPRQDRGGKTDRPMMQGKVGNSERSVSGNKEGKDGDNNNSTRNTERERRDVESKKVVPVDNINVSDEQNDHGHLNNKDIESKAGGDFDFNLVRQGKVIESRDVLKKMPNLSSKHENINSNNNNNVIVDKEIEKKATDKREKFFPNHVDNTNEIINEVDINAKPQRNPRNRDDNRRNKDNNSGRNSATVSVGQGDKTISKRVEVIVNGDII